MGVSCTAGLPAQCQCALEAHSRHSGQGGSTRQGGRLQTATELKYHPSRSLAGTFDALSMLARINERVREAAAEPRGCVCHHERPAARRWLRVHFHSHVSPRRALCDIARESPRRAPCLDAFGLLALELGAAACRDRQPRDDTAALAVALADDMLRESPAEFGSMDRRPQSQRARTKTTRVTFGKRENSTLSPANLHTFSARSCPSERAVVRARSAARGRSCGPSTASITGPPSSCRRRSRERCARRSTTRVRAAGPERSLPVMCRHAWHRARGAAAAVCAVRGGVRPREWPRGLVRARSRVLWQEL